MFKVIVAGSRGFADYALLESKLDYLLSDKPTGEVVIVSGTARGADQLGERYAARHHMRVELHPANWEMFGKSAGFRRNQQMALVADALVAFWDGESRGTKHMIEYMRMLGKPVRVVRYRKP